MLFYFFPYSFPPVIPGSDQWRAILGLLKESTLLSFLPWPVAIIPLSFFASNSSSFVLHCSKQPIRGIEVTLMEANLDLSMTYDSSNTTVLHTAASQGHTEVVNFLLEKDSSVAAIASRNGKTALHSAAKNGHLEIVKALLSKEPGIATRIDKNGQTALHMAVKGQNVEVVDELIKSDPSLINMVDAKGNTALHIGSRKGRIQVVNSYITLQQITNQKLLIVQKLLNHSGDHKLVINKFGETAPDTAEIYKLSDIAGILRNHGVQCAKFIEPQPTNSARELNKTPSDIRNEVHQQLLRTRQTRKRVRDIAKKLNRMEVHGLNNAIISTTVVAVLIATIAFAAIFNIPGQYADSPEDTTPFMIFVVSDSVALFISLGVVLVQTSVAVTGRQAKKQLMAVINKLLCLACVLVSVAFLGLSYIVVGEDERWLANVVTGIGTVIMVSTLGTLCTVLRIQKLGSSGGQQPPVDHHTPIDKDILNDEDFEIIDAV
ncbi:Ankyrin repeat family protein, putative [Theobroma cacao]|uniref:Ankyrin repeat family protein, putative n=1 Tax=Theobroma cacao TaxID=3641 RepID=A0A061GIX3_THECC|nr:Ankyrin repeat family protein, putative [Theobroma cacao]